MKQLAHDFLSRSRELKLLENAWRSPQSGLIPIYGRRRIGKSTMIQHFLRGKRGVYAVGKRGPAALQIQDFLDAAANDLGEPLFAQLRIDGWQSALKAVVDRPREGKLVLALDEFQWMAEASPELPSVLQALWDRDWSKRGDVLVLLCGSLIGFMEREVLGSESPLFGRRTAQILLQPFDFREARAFHPGWSLHEAAKVWFVCGGVPAYLRQFDPARSFEANLREQVLEEFAPMHREPDFLLREELRELPTYYAVLMALAEGLGTLPEIAARSGVNARSLPYYLQTLCELRYVRKRHPLDGGAPNPRRVRYTLQDPLLRFWFRFVYPNLSLLGHMGPSVTFTRQIAPQLQAWFGARFEAMCAEALPMLYAEAGVEAPFEIGEFWSPQTQIDAVGLRADGVTELVECRWGEAPTAVDVARELRKKAALFPNPRGATTRLRVMSQRAPTGPVPDDVTWTTLEAMYGVG